MVSRAVSHAVSHAPSSSAAAASGAPAGSASTASAAQLLHLADWSASLHAQSHTQSHAPSHTQNSPKTQSQTLPARQLLRRITQAMDRDIDPLELRLPMSQDVSHARPFMPPANDDDRDGDAHHDSRDEHDSRDGQATARHQPAESPSPPTAPPPQPCDPAMASDYARHLSSMSEQELHAQFAALSALLTAKMDAFQSLLESNQAFYNSLAAEMDGARDTAADYGRWLDGHRASLVHRFAFLADDTRLAKRPKTDAHGHDNNASLSPQL
ncbi:hypothetical protein BC831DRAFT_463729 [Entophlyctis helioformis]|nr:hypothetical protein BC831DRAFT_463729 [Entophlyctis helioformis]